MFAADWGFALARERVAELRAEADAAWLAPAPGSGDRPDAGRGRPAPADSRPGRDT